MFMYLNKFDSSAVRMKPGMGSLHMVSKLIPYSKPFPTSRVAFDETGRPVGAAVNNVCNKHEVGVELEEELKEVEDPRYKPIRAIHHTLRCPDV